MDSYASIWRLCKVPFFRLPKSPPQPHPSAAERCRVEYSLFGPIPQHLLSDYLCFDPIPLNSPSNQQQGCSSSFQYSQSPVNSVQDPQISLSELCLDKNDQTTTPPCCSVCYEEDSIPDQGYEVREKQQTHTPILCVMNFQNSLPPVSREEESSLGTRNSYGESSILLLEELKELALWDKDCVMDDDDVGYMVSVTSKFRKLAFVSEVTLNSRYELMSELLESKKLHKFFEAESDKYFTRSTLANANDATFKFIDLDDYNLTKKKKSYEKQKEFQVEYKAADENANIEEDIPSTEPRSNAHPVFSSLGNRSIKGLGSLIHCYSSVVRSKSTSKARKRLFVDSDEPLLKKSKHSLG